MTRSDHRQTPRIAVTSGEPAGIGPELVATLAQESRPAQIVVIGDPELMRERARQTGADVEITGYDPAAPPTPVPAGTLIVDPCALRVPAVPGELNPRNSAYVIETLERACDGCASGEFDAMLTAPVNKGVINDAGIPFSGHTEFLALRCGAGLPVMLLVADELRVALVTTHLPLRDVADAIDADRLRATLRVLDAGLTRWFGLTRPRITVLGLNPHAGESGHLGDEEGRIIDPVLQELRADGMRLTGPLPADTAFTARHLAEADAVLAMYHDQGLTVPKHRGFGHAVNVTLGLPFIRTSVDHGTALDLAGHGTADAGSLRAALALAIRMHGRATT
jgi:4-hydroxythreonine-4-phosphate dehydrogenase